MFDDFFGLCDFDGNGEMDAFEFATEAFIINEMLNDDDEEDEFGFEDEEDEDEW